MSEILEKNWVPGFWKRIAALFIDVLCLGALGFIVSVGFEHALVAMGSWARAIGFSIALLYFGLLNSNVAGAQTIGKRLLNIKVVNANNQEIGIGRSFVRAAILLIPVFLNHLKIANDVMQSFIIYPLSLIVFGGILSTIYLYIFNRATRQALHDFAVGSFVVNTNALPGNILAPWKFHFFIVAFLYVTAILAPVFTLTLSQKGMFNDLLKAQDTVAHFPGVSYASISYDVANVASTNSEATSSKYVSATVFLLEKNINDVKLAHDLAVVVLNHYPESKNSKVIHITLIYGYDIGIWSQWYSVTHNFNPAEL